MIQRYFFTFGQAHTNKAGVQLRDYFVTVTAFDPHEAQDIFREQFATRELPRPEQWSVMYTEGDFNPNWYRRGEFVKLPHAPAGHRFFNFRWHVRSLENLAYYENHYELMTRREAIFMLERLQKLGFTSRSVYRLDGSIEVVLEHPHEHVSGLFTPSHVYRIKQVPSHGKQPEPRRIV